jgi:hypothetical protein
MLYRRNTEAQVTGDCEVDFVVPLRGRLWMLEVKAARTVRPSDAKALTSIGPRAKSSRVERWVVHRAARTPTVTSALAPGVGALTIEQLVGRINGS